MDRLSRNTPMRWGAPRGAAPFFKLFVLSFFAVFLVLALLLAIWIVVDPSGGSRFILRVESLLNRLSSTSQDFEEFAFSYENFRRDVQALSADPIPLRKTVTILARSEGLDPDLFWSIIQVEVSSSPEAAFGSTAHVENPLDPYANIRNAVHTFALLLHQFQGDVRKALAAFLSGPGAAHSAAPSAETERFIERVLASTRAAAAEKAAPKLPEPPRPLRQID